MFSQAGFGSGRYRLITGRALEVLPRLADSAYDMVFCDADKREYPEYLSAALRLLGRAGSSPSTTRCGRTRALTWRTATRKRASVGELRELVFADDSLVPMLLPDRRRPARGRQAARA